MNVIIGNLMKTSQKLQIFKHIGILNEKLDL